MITFIIGAVIGVFIGIGMVALLTGNSYEDGYRQAMADMERKGK